MTTGTEKRRKECMVRVDQATHIRLAQEAKRRGLAMGECVEALLPGDRWNIDKCRYCRKMVRSPMKKHRYHEYKCVLYAEREPAQGG